VTTVDPEPVVSHRAAKLAAVWLLVPTASTIAWLLCLPWHAEKKPGADGQLHGPYSEGQVLSLAMILAVVAAGGGLLRHPLLTALLLGATTSTMFCLDAITSDDPGFFAVSAPFIFAGVFAVALLPAFGAEEARKAFCR
jgi:hypothetical protein